MLVNGMQTGCGLCGQPLKLTRQGLCNYCYAQIATIPAPCYCCGLPTIAEKICSSCQQQPPPWQVLMAVSAYAYPVKVLLHRFKFSRHVALSRTLARLLLLIWLHYRRQYGLSKPDRVIAVPLSRQRQWQRGFNQSALLAKQLAAWLDVTYDPKLLSRRRAANHQKALTAKARRSNLIGAFHCQGNIAGERLLLVDDVVTTGSTIAEICRELNQHQPAEIQIICLCRTL